MTEGNTGHTAECRYYETGNIKDCDCKKKPQENKCDSCIMLKEANKLKIPIANFSLDVENEPEYCRKCYQDERKANKPQENKC